MSENSSPDQQRKPWDSILATDGFVIGIEIGVPRSKVAICGMDGAAVDDLSRLGPARETASETLAAVYHMIAELCTRNGVSTDRVLRIGIGFAGPVAWDKGLILVSHRAPGWENVPLQALFEEKYNIPTVVDNDANVAALGEATFGATGGVRDLLYIHIGEGVGGALLLDGHIYHGASGTAGEVGHMVVDPDGPICSCGGRGHLEAVVSRRAIVDRAQGLTAATVSDSMMLSLAGGDPSRIDVEHVFAAAAKGDGAAVSIVDDVLRYMSIGIASLVNILNPQVISIGGPVADVGGALFTPLEEMVRREAMSAPGRTARIIPAYLGSEATIRGAVALALYSLQY